jgi:hypothetical protein
LRRIIMSVTELVYYNSQLFEHMGKMVERHGVDSLTFFNA